MATGHGGAPSGLHTEPNPEFQANGMIASPKHSKYRKPDGAELSDQPVSAGDYFGTTINGKKGHVWRFDGTVAARVGVPNPDQHSMATVQAGQSLREALASLPAFSEKQFVIHRMELPPGAFYRRIARPSDQHPLEAPGLVHLMEDELDAPFSSLNQMRSLVGLLNTIFQAVHPVSSNMTCFGSATRNLLILACTECEAQWRGVLAANGYLKPRTNTEDYVKLLPAMRLNEYEVRLQHYPWLPPIAPFGSWDTTASTQSLGWYENYNAAKHDREAYFDRASLESALQAVVGVWVMIAAQFGIDGIREFDDLSRYFHLESVPLWRYSQVYTYAYDNFAGEAGPRDFLF